MDSDPAEARRQASEAHRTRAERQLQRPIGREAYRHMLRVAFQGDVLGESAYAVAARLTWVPRRRREWEALLQLKPRPGSVSPRCSSVKVSLPEQPLSSRWRERWWACSPHSRRGD